MATTYTLKRKYFADSNNDKKGGMSTGKKLGLAAAGTTALAGLTAAAAMRGKGQLTKQTFQSFGNFKSAVGKTFKNAEGKIDLFGKGTGALRGQNLGQGFKSLGQGAVNVGKQGVGKVKSWFGKGGTTATQA